MATLQEREPTYDFVKFSKKKSHEIMKILGRRGRRAPGATPPDPPLTDTKVYCGSNVP